MDSRTQGAGVMEGEAVPVVAEWALWGARYGDGPGYRLLEFSEGAIPRDVFVEVILRRFLTDAVDQPQVIIGGFSPGANGRYLGIAINDRDERAPDSAGRPAMLTSFYCVPFDQLAAGSVSYQAMYERFRDSPLPVAGQRPLQTSLAGAPQGLRPPRLALQAAAELLTGRPVCILGAEHVPLRERL